MHIDIEPFVFQERENEGEERCRGRRQEISRDSGLVIIYFAGERTREDGLAGPRVMLLDPASADGARKGLGAEGRGRRRGREKVMMRVREKRVGGREEEKEGHRDGDG